MGSLPRALIISNFPIVAAAACSAFSDSYHFEAMTWGEYVSGPKQAVDLVIVDVTTVDTETALVVVNNMFPGTRIVVCSLHHNEVEVYRAEPNGLMADGELPNLFALTA